MITRPITDEEKADLNARIAYQQSILYYDKFNNPVFKAEAKAKARASAVRNPFRCDESLDVLAQYQELPTQLIVCDIDLAESLFL